MEKSRSIVAGAFFVLALTAGWTHRAMAQRYVDVQAGYGTLQAVLSADSLNRVANPNTIYLLHRGSADSLYYLTSTLTAWGSMPLQIQSSGTGPLPKLIMTTLSDGSTITPIISVKADFSMKGVAMTGTNTLGVVADRIIRIQNDSVTLRLDSVQFSNSTQSFIRVDNGHSKIFLRDCRVGNVYSDWSNARGVDNRGVTIDTLSVEGCSFYRLAYRVYRDGGGILNYGFFNHNTFTEIANTILGLGSTLDITFTNNLAVNCEFIGQGQSSAGRLLSIIAVPGLTARIHHNVFYSDTAALYAAYHTSSDTIVFPGWFADTLNALIAAAGMSGTNISSPVTFTMPPNNVPNAVKIDSIARWYLRNPVLNSGDASILNVDSIKYVDLSYNTDAAAYTFGSDGKPVGATGWFGMTPDAVERNQSSEVPLEYLLDHNYPNPFNPSTTISYTLPHSGHVRLTVYDLYGRQLESLVDGVQPAGTHRALFTMRGIASGTYFYRLIVDGKIVGVHKMLLLK
jgi:hypothetical protein